MPDCAAILALGYGFVIKVGSLDPAIQCCTSDGAGDKADGDFWIGFQHFEGEGNSGANATGNAPDLGMDGVSGDDPFAVGIEGEKARVIDLGGKRAGIATDHVGLAHQ